MFGIWLDFGRPLLSLLLVGIAIKLLDDSLDVSYDLAQGRQTVAAKLGRAVVPYALVAGMLSMVLNQEIALAAFFGSYAVGMFSNWRETLPTRLPAWLEIAVAIGVSFWLVDWRMAIWGVAMMSVLDWLDDVLDAGGDKDTGQWNLANRIGIVETLLLILIALTTAVLTNARLTALTFISVPILEMLSQSLTKRVAVGTDNTNRIETEKKVSS